MSEKPSSPSSPGALGTGRTSLTIPIPQRVAGPAATGGSPPGVPDEPQSRCDGGKCEADEEGTDWNPHRQSKRGQGKYRN